MPSCGCRPPKDVAVVECKDVKFHKCLFTHITTSVGITVPNNILLEVNYKICFGNATCEKGVISVFANPGTVQKNLEINSDHFVILEDTVRMISQNLIDSIKFIQDLNFRVSFVRKISL